MNTVKEAKPSFTYEGHQYFNRANAARYVGVTNSWLRLRMHAIEKENGLTFPFLTFPTSLQRKTQEMYIDSRILDILRKPVSIGKEQEWINELKEIIQEVQQ